MRSSLATRCSHPCTRTFLQSKHFFIFYAKVILRIHIKAEGGVEWVSGVG